MIDDRIELLEQFLEAPKPWPVGHDGLYPMLELRDEVEERLKKQELQFLYALRHKLKGGEDVREGL